MGLPDLMVLHVGRNLKTTLDTAEVKTYVAIVIIHSIPYFNISLIGAFT